MTFCLQILLHLPIYYLNYLCKIVENYESYQQNVKKQQMFRS